MILSFSNTVLFTASAASLILLRPPETDFGGFCSANGGEDTADVSPRSFIFASGEIAVILVSTLVFKKYHTPRAATPESISTDNVNPITNALKFIRVRILFDRVSEKRISFQQGYE